MSTCFELMLPVDIIAEAKLDQPTMRGVREKDRPRMSVGMLFTKDLQEHHIFTKP